jgi:ATP-dependent RNA helicase SUPV3L1/SUV3
VLVEGEPVGRLHGFRFQPDRSTGDMEEGRAVLRATRRALGQALHARITDCEQDADENFALALDERGRRVRLLWRGAPVAVLRPGDGMLQPRLRLIADDLLDSGQARRLRDRLEAWLRAHVRQVFAPLHRLADAAEDVAASKPLGGAARGLAYQLIEGLGTVPRDQVGAQLDGLPDADRRRLGRLGLRFGVETLYMPAMLRPAPARLAALLWRVAEPGAPALSDGVLAGLGSRTALPDPAALPGGFWRAVGYLPVGPLALRADVLERLTYQARDLGRQGPFVPPAAMLSLVGCGRAELGAVLATLGYRPGEVEEDGDSVVRFAPARGRRKSAAKPGKRRGAPESPFAALRDLIR